MARTEIDQCVPAVSYTWKQTKFESLRIGASVEVVM